MTTHTPQYARSEYYTQLAKMSFDKVFDLTAGVYFNFCNNIYILNNWIIFAFIFWWSKRNHRGEAFFQILR